VTDLTHPAETALATETLGRLSAGELDQYTAERRLIDADGNVVPVLVDVMLVRADGGDPLFVVVMVIPRDSAYAALREEMRGTVHDLNNLLMAVVGHAEFLIHREDPGGHADAIREAGSRATSLVRRLLVTDPLPHLPGTVDVNSAILGMQGVMAQLAGSGDDIVLSLDPSAPAAIADREELERALGNLVANARDAMPRGGRVTIETHVVDDTVEIAVSDTGVGIPKELHEKIFEREFSTKPPGIGYGIGLANVCAFVRSVGGSIRVDSEPGHGATFTVSLPRAS
jgi:signal transduction histidine kinase